MFQTLSGLKARTQDTEQWNKIVILQNAITAHASTTTSKVPFLKEFCRDFLILHCEHSTSNIKGC